MCGICGFAYNDPARPAEKARLLRMREAVAHRGPDGAGDHYSGPVALGHRRLSIIDLEGGYQPLANESNDVWVTFNGEIYNYLPLTEELRRRGHQFRTRSDTEVLVHAYEEYGDEFPRLLNGIFTFALQDVRRGRVLLARDHFGIKPLFYSVTEDGLFFGSEIKAVLAGTGGEAKVSKESLTEYLTFRYVAGERSFFDGVKRLPPGHTAVWEHGKLQVRPFWSITSDPANITVSVDEAAETLDAHLARAVELQMMSEVPLGTFCSGGVDSGLVSAHASRLSPHQLMTFSVGFEDPEWDESALAADTAKRFATDHHCVIARPEEFESLLSKLIWYHDEPLSHPNSVPLYVLSAFARKRVTVVLTGEGSDELFAGYPRYHIARLRGRLDPVPRHGLAVLGGIVGLLPGHKADRLASLLPLSFADSVIFNSAYADPSLVRALTGCDINDVIGHRRRMLEESFVPGDPLSTISRYELRTYLVCLLDRMDRMAMASGLEGRVPFLDVPLAEWALRLHSSLKLGLRENKRVVKRAAQGLLSPKITGGRKSGFGMPLDAWFRQREFARLVAKLQDPNHPATECLDYATVAKILREHTSGAADHGEVLWLIANVYLWHEVQGESRRQWAPPQAAAAVRV